jgi:AcrR family transcriptional regulator
MATGKRAAAGERLSAADWEAAALDALAEDGLNGLSVEALARRLGVTKGSFYWHFADREALLAAALARWEESHTGRVIAALAGARDPRRRLTRLLGLALAGGRSDRIHVALANTSHPLVRDALARVTRRRVAYLESCYLELGSTRPKAKQSALLAYAVYLGLVRLRLEAPKEIPAAIEHIVKRLVP